MEETAKSILAEVPSAIEMAPVMKKYPVLYEQSMNTVLLQEIIRYVDEFCLNNLFLKYVEWFIIFFCHEVIS